MYMYRLSEINALMSYVLFLQLAVGLYRVNKGSQHIFGNVTAVNGFYRPPFVHHNVVK